MDIVKLLNYMENLRYERKLSQEEYLGDIISQRQYYRYRYGESEPPFEIIVKLAIRLDIPFSVILDMFQNETKTENVNVQLYFNFVLNRELKKADNLKQIIDKRDMINELNTRFMDLGDILNKYYLGKISKLDLADKIKSIAKFQRIMKLDSLHDTELYMLGVLMEYSDNDRQVILNKFMELHGNGKLLTNKNYLHSSQLNFWIIKNLGRLKQLKDLVIFANLAIEYSKLHKSYYLVEYFYYYLSLAYFRLGDTKNFEIELMKTIQALKFIHGDKNHRIYDMIIKDIGVNPKKFYIDKL